MREVADADRIRRFMRTLAEAGQAAGRVYFTGGATAVLIGWRSSTIDIDIKIVPEHDHLFRAIPRIKEILQINVELACPADFIPVLPGWEERSPFIVSQGRLSFHHFDLYAQALAKVERSHTQDVADVAEMVRRGLVEPARAWQYFQAIEPDLYRFPAVDTRSFRQAAEEVFGRPPEAAQPSPLVA
jgi:hypothetical protein